MLLLQSFFGASSDSPSSSKEDSKLADLERKLATETRVSVVLVLLSCAIAFVESLFSLLEVAEVRKPLQIVANVLQLSTASPIVQAILDVLLTEKAPTQDQASILQAELGQLGKAATLFRWAVQFENVLRASIDFLLYKQCKL